MPSSGNLFSVPVLTLLSYEVVFLLPLLQIIPLLRGVGMG